MVNFKEEIAALIAAHVEGLTAEEIGAMIEAPQDKSLGDYAFPCFRLAKTLRKAPPLIAADIAAAISGQPLFAKVEQVNAYVNMFISRAELVGEVTKEVLNKGADYGKSDIGQGRTDVAPLSSLRQPARRGR